MWLRFSHKHCLWLFTHELEEPLTSPFWLLFFASMNRKLAVTASSAPQQRRMHVVFAMDMGTPVKLWKETSTTPREWVGVSVLVSDSYHAFRAGWTSHNTFHLWPFFFQSEKPALILTNYISHTWHLFWYGWKTISYYHKNFLLKTWFFLIGVFPWSKLFL